MYEEFYGLTEKPFAVAPNPAFLYLGKKHKQALSRLQFSIFNKTAFTVITGDIGSGKTTLVRELIHELDEADVAVGLVSNVNFSTYEELLKWILYAFELEYENKDKVALFDTFTEFVIENYRHGKETVLIIDEAQNLQPEIIEQLRMLSNINAGQHQVLQLILVGQPNLMDILKRPGLEQFVQRVEVEYFLRPLDLKETGEYIRHRLKVAGGDENLFQPDTYPLIWRSTNGIPRLINILCGMALVYGFAEKAKVIDKNIFKLVLADKAGGFTPIDTSAAFSDSSPSVTEIGKNGFRALKGQNSKGEGFEQDSRDLSTIEKLFSNNQE